MRLAVLLGLLCVAGTSGWLALDRSAAHILHSELERFAFDDVLDFEELVLRTTRHVAVRGARLSDPVRGEVVAQVGHLELGFRHRDWSGGQPPLLASVHGIGGRLVLSFEDGELVLARAIEALVRRILDLPRGKAKAAFPVLLFEDLEVVIVGAGYALQRFAEVGVEILQLEDHAVEVRARERGGGRLRLVLDEHGVRALDLEGLRVEPVAAQLVPELDEVLGRVLGPSGRLDLEADFSTHADPLVAGVLRDASLDVHFVPFALGPAEIPFAYREGRLAVDRARVDFEGGSAELSVRGTAEDLLVTLDVAGAEFREEFLHLVPGYEDLGFVECSDGGRFELHLEAPFRNELLAGELTGSGGFHVRAMRLDPPGVQLEDVVGRFAVRGAEMELLEVAARCAGGGVVGSGLLFLDTGEYRRVRLTVQDLDLGKLHAMGVVGPGHEGHVVSGWLEGRLRCRGNLARAESMRGQGQLSIRAANLWSTPLIEALLMTLPLGRDGEGQQGLSSGFSIRDRRVELDGLRLDSDFFSLRGTGWVDFDRRLSLEMSLRVPLGPFGRLVEFFQQRFLVNVLVRGTLQEPKVVARALDVVTGPLSRLWDALWGSDEERDAPPAEPVPAAADPLDELDDL